MIEVVSAEAWHLEQIQLKSVFDSEGDVRKRLRAALALPYTFTILNQGVPVAIIGGEYLWNGVARVWAVVSDGARKNPLAFHRAVLRFMKFFRKGLSLHRVQMTVKCDFIEGIRWAESLGFKNEVRLAKYGPDGSDYFLFAKVW